MEVMWEWHERNWWQYFGVSWSFLFFYQHSYTSFISPLYCSAFRCWGLCFQVLDHEGDRVLSGGQPLIPRHTGLFQHPHALQHSVRSVIYSFITLYLKTDIFKSDVCLISLPKVTEMYWCHATLMPFRSQMLLRSSNLFQSRSMNYSLLLFNIFLVLLIQDQSMESFGLGPLRSITFFQHICCTSVFNGSWRRFGINPLVTESSMIEISLNCKHCGDTLNITLYIQTYNGDMDCVCLWIY